MLNRLRTELRTGGCRNRTLQKDWSADGPEAFTFEVLDLLPPAEDPDADLGEDLAMLEEMWREKLGIDAMSSY